MRVDEFLEDGATFRSDEERYAQLRGLRIQLEYDPLQGNKELSKAAIVEARMKTISGTGDPVSEQKFRLKDRDGKTNIEVTVQAYFEKSKIPLMSFLAVGTDRHRIQHQVE